MFLKSIAPLSVATTDLFTAPPSPEFSVLEPSTRGFTAGEDAHDGYPGGKVSSVEVHGTGADDDIDHSGAFIGQAIYGFAGDDTIYSSALDDKVFGGLGNDTVYAGDGADILVGGEGDDFLAGDAGEDEIHTGDGADTAWGGADDDFIFLTDDNQTDTILYAAGDGADVVDGFETGVDEVHLTGAGQSFDALDITYNADGTQALLDLGGGDQIIFTGLDGNLTAADFVL